MDSLETYRQIIEMMLSAYTHVRYAYGEIQNETIFDHAADRYLVMSVGWDKAQRIHGALIHIDIIDGKVWIQRDGTEHGIANDLVAAGIPKDRIVLGFHAPEVRPYTEFAVA
ncbi:MAG: XisI protein [Chloroflexi bacterium]|nr:XisI protein [Chloroflexota bacterium]